jgi:hypothetical protein
VRARILGPDHTDTLDSRHRLIYALTRQTKHAEAEAEAREVLKLREKVLGLEHADTVVSGYNLADTLVDQGEYAEAEATALGSEGRNAEAEPLYREMIRTNEKVLGPEHPDL